MLYGTPVPGYVAPGPAVRAGTERVRVAFGFEMPVGNVTVSRQYDLGRPRDWWDT